ncbi:CATRA conflict system CASPASE/TPR repeat-associated protein [Planomonospora venezuelensis]|uniref:Uncharacterized protein n=1 Tax=Planomonospora venezuelensis TaxID=1999 RepID=A0A841D6H7_PLAVE|nr:CATRA conflict system CASPASE/TPR repeat-associated protein [Planomonospora venezuelensis]MBB5964104.1 hypothetical protein [Planomonospora venezuelensis]GIM99728.1 hypothetical protein Pve01_13870 [Planomonospora venezuelensis]
MTRIREQALLVHAFTAVGDDGDSWREPVRRLWQIFLDLGEARAISPHTALDVPAELPPAGRFTVLTAAEIPGRGTYQAVLYREHDVIGLMVMLAAEEAKGWDFLDGQWPHEASGGLGTARIHLGVTVPRRLRLRRTRDVLPDRLGPGPVWSRGGITVRELPSARAPRRPATRRLVVLAEPGDEEEMYTWTWSSGAAELRPFGRYLLHSAKMRWAWWLILNEDRFRRVSVEVDTLTDRLAGLLHDAAARGGRVTTAELAHGQAAVVSAVSGNAGLVTALRDLRTIRLSVKIAAENMRAAIREDAAAGTFLDHDRRLSDRLAEQLDADIVYVEATRDSATDVAQAARTMIEERLRHREQRLTLLQASLLGALLMALGAIQSLDYRVPLPSRSQAPVIVLLAALALTAPPIVHRFASSPARLNATDRILTALSGGALGWFACSVATYGSGRPPLPPVQALAASSAGAALLLVTLHLAWWLLRRRTTPHSRHRSRQSSPAEPGAGSVRS